jgi:glycosyl-4,4'-diaponeurosporenoate acyltransferase
MTALLWTANLLGWPVIQVGLAALFLRLPGQWFAKDGALYQARAWEEDGRFYTRWLQIRRWKRLLPDGAPWVGGMSKKRLQSRDPRFLETFILETRRAECAHWCMLLCLPLFFLCNPPWARWVMTAYAVAANLPCIVAQRYNRLVLQRHVCRGREAPRWV